jgi:S1-C subfamily serine protease
MSNVNVPPNALWCSAIWGKAMSLTPSITVILALFVLFTCGSVRAQDSPHIGVKIRTLTLELRKQHKLAADVKGALVTDVTAGSPAKEQGITVGDIIVEAEGKPVAAAKDVASQIAAATAAGKDKIALRIVNAKGERREVTVGLEKRPAEGSKSLLPGPK